MAVNGIFTSNSGIQGERQPTLGAILMKGKIAGDAPMLALSSGMNRVQATDVSISWNEEMPNIGRAQVNGTINSSATSLVVVDSSSIVAGMYFMVEATGEYVLITAVNNVTHTLTILRGFAGTTAGNITDAGFIQRIATAHEEGSDKPTAYSNQGYPRTNFLQTFRNTWALTRTADKIVKFKTGDKKAKNKSDALDEHKKDIERALWDGRKVVGKKDGKNFYTMDGIIPQITTNVEDATGGWNYEDMRDFLEQIFLYGVQGQPDERIAFCGNGVLKFVDAMTRGESTFNIEAGQAKFGIKTKMLITPFGDINLVTHPLWNVNPVWTNRLVVMHPGAVTHFVGDDGMHEDVAKNGTDATEGVFTSDRSIGLAVERVHGVVNNLSTYAA